jgi:hypothetical protein
MSPSHGLHGLCELPCDSYVSASPSGPPGGEKDVQLKSSDGSQSEQELMHSREELSPSYDPRKTVWHWRGPCMAHITIPFQLETQ